MGSARIQPLSIRKHLDASQMLGSCIRMTPTGIWALPKASVCLDDQKITFCCLKMNLTCANMIFYFSILLLNHKTILKEAIQPLVMSFCLLLVSLHKSKCFNFVYFFHFYAYTVPHTHTYLCIRTHPHPPKNNFVHLHTQFLHLHWIRTRIDNQETLRQEGEVLM